MYLYAGPALAVKNSDFHEVFAFVRDNINKGLNYPLYCDTVYDGNVYVFPIDSKPYCLDCQGGKDTAFELKCSYKNDFAEEFKNEIELLTTKFDCELKNMVIFQDA